MLKKLSLRFSIAAISALFVIELLMILLINGLNYRYTLKQTDELLQMICDNGGSFPEPVKMFDDHMNEQFPDSMRPSDKPSSKPDNQYGNEIGAEGGFGGENRFRREERADRELRYATRYFTATADKSGKITRLDTGHIATVSSEQAQEYALDIFEKDDSKGFYDSFGFRWQTVTNSDGSRLAVFCDFSNAAQGLIRVGGLSLAISGGLLVVFSVIIVLVSKRVVRPVIENSEKQSRFITDAGHELKTPLAIIRANTEVIEMTAGESEWTRSTINQTDRLSDLLGRMLMLAKSQESQRFSFADVDITALSEELTSNFETYCTAEGKPLKTEIEQGLHITGDVKMLDMLLSTLLENAVKYGKADSPITFRLYSTNKHIKFSITNLCTDPPTGDTSLLFDRFYRGDSSRTRETGGSGIGLSIAKTITEAHKGKISCTVEGEEVTFDVKLKK